LNKLFDLSGRVALVTGAGQGMGLGIVRALATQGARVLLNDYHAERAERAAAALRGQGLEVSAAPGDITAAGIPDSLAAKARELYGDIDVLVNNAGVPLGMSTSLRTFEHLGSADFERQLDLNFRAVVNLCRAVLPAMRQRKFGRIVTISSESWRLGQSMGLTDYAAAKAATIGFMRNLCKEVGPRWRHGRLSRRQRSELDDRPNDSAERWLDDLLSTLTLRDLLERRRRVTPVEHARAGFIQAQNQVVRPLTYR